MTRSSRPELRSAANGPIVGFTGTREGLRLKQTVEVIRQLKRLSPSRVVHGGCVGADAQFDAICREMGIAIGVRPCTIEWMRAKCDSPWLAEPEPPLARNRKIVADSGVLIAAPLRFHEELRSGTWATVRYARGGVVNTVIVFPDGTVKTRVGA